MGDQFKKTYRTILFSGILFCLLSSTTWAAIAIQTEVVSGMIVKVGSDHSVRLDNGKIYHPSRPELKIDSQAGQPITLRYTAVKGEKNIFFEYAPGLNSLQKKPQPSFRKDNTPK